MHPMLNIAVRAARSAGNIIARYADQVDTLSISNKAPNDFVSELSQRLKWQSVVSWLEEFGSQGRYIAPLVAGSLLGLAFRDSSQPLPTNEEIVSTDNLVSALESMAYRPAEAKEMVRSATPRLRADMTLEEAIRITLQMGKGGDLQ